MNHRWKVLIADDEPIIREGLRESVQWETIGLEVVAEAEDGEEALELAILHEIHILLVDLNMPIMNGLTLMKKIREKMPVCRIIIITGHDEFSYAQEAIQLGVDDYILKPVNAGQLSKVLEGLSKDLHRQFQEEKHLLVASNQISKNISMLRERFCLEWIEGHLSEKEIIEQMEFLKLPCKSPEFIGAIRWFERDAGKPFISEKDRQLYLYAIENIVEELLRSWPHYIFRDHYGVIIVFIWSEVPEELLESIEKAVRTYLKITTIQSFAPVKKLMEVMQSYQDVKTNVYRITQLSPMVRRGRQFIKEHFADSNLSLEDVSETLQVSSVYLSRKFKEELGTSFIHVLSEIRMTKAIELLNTTDTTINEIAKLVGFENQHYFSTSFKKIVGVSPNQYRNGKSGG
jgi:two-component system response regulator YesN